MTVVTVSILANVREERWPADGVEIALGKEAVPSVAERMVSTGFED